MKERTNRLVSRIRNEFNRLISFKKDNNVQLVMCVENRNLQLTFTDGKISQSVNVPLPTITSEGLEILHKGDVKRVLCDYWLEAEQKRLNYHDIMEHIIMHDINKIMPNKAPGSSMIHKIINSFDRNMTPYMVHQLRIFIGETVGLMPLHETNMNSWAMRNRLMIVDELFHRDELKDPNKRLDYQVNKNDKYYSKYGWTSIGLSDGTLADKNNILTVDLRNTIPYGHHHNPQRNLYSTLGMKGDEFPRVMSKTMANLMERGISRKGWNLFTVILDIDLVFEDQILVSNRHKDKGHTTTRRYTVYGENVLVDIGDNIHTGQVIGLSDKDEPIIMDLRCDSGKVINVSKDTIDVGGDLIDVNIVKVEGFRLFRDGTKFSNLAGNKGIIRLMDLGYAVDPRTGENVPIDVIVSAKSINKRKNFSQIIEAITNNVCPGNECVVVPDDKTTTNEKLMKALQDCGLPKDGTWATYTPWGDFRAISGNMFWGVTKDSEDQSWRKKRTVITNNRELRISGLKFSHVELKALTTRFGPSNAVLKEIMSYAQGTEILIDEMKILKSMRGELPSGIPEVLFSDVPYVDNSTGMFHTDKEISGTVVDEMFFDNGFTLLLPLTMEARVPKEDPDNYVVGTTQTFGGDDTINIYQFDKIYIPNTFLRRCWKHPSGKWGFSTIGAHINHIIQRCHQYKVTENTDDKIAVVHAVMSYFKEICRMMGTKRGDIAAYGMSVRYPHSARGTATLKIDLPDNTIEIHRDMANVLGVAHGDVIIAERFPCLGFMSIRPQYVHITDDDECRYTIRVSGNSLVSMDLDFDGDTIFLASFKTPEAIEALKNEMVNPNKICETEIRKLNNKKVPCTMEMSIEDYEIVTFPPMGVAEHSNVVRKSTGVKSHTGPVIALAYNLMRIVERHVPFTNVKQHAALEIMLHFLGNTVFKQKHGVESLQEAATDAVCMADVGRLVDLGFERSASELLCNLIVKEAKKLGIHNVTEYHIEAKEKGWSKIINRIVKTNNRVYFASRANLSPYTLLQYLESEAVDLPSIMFHTMLKSPVKSVEAQLHTLRLTKELREARFKSDISKDVYSVLSSYIDDAMGKNAEL